MSCRVLIASRQVEVDDPTPDSTNAEAKIRRGISFLADLTRGALPADERSAAALTFIDVLDDGGCAPMLAHDLRAQFVSAVLDLGYPYALHLDPEDLTPLRSTPRRVRRSLPTALAALAGLALGLLGAVAPLASSKATPVTPPLAAVAPVKPVVTPVSPPLAEAKVVNAKPVRDASFEPTVISHPRISRGRGGPSWPPAVGSTLEQLRARQPVIAELESLAKSRAWPEVIRVGDRCRSADPLRLDCLAHVAAAHAHLSQRPSSPLFGSHWQRLAALDRLEHDRAARALYRRYLSIAPPDDPHAAKIVSALRADGDWVEPPGRQAKVELRVLHQTVSCNGDLECLNLAAATWAQRAARTHDPDDLAQAQRVQREVDEARRRLTLRGEPL